MAIPHSPTGTAAWTDLLRLLKDAETSDLIGEPKLKEVNHRRFWYDQYRLGTTVRHRYIGEDTPELRGRLETISRQARRRDDAERERSRLMRVLRAEGYLMPDVGTGQIVSAMARVGAFRLGGTLVGTQAFRTYEGELGIRIGAQQMAMTGDIDIASFERLSVVLQDRVDEPLQGEFAALKFEPVPALDPGRVWRWKQTERQTLVEFLTPSFSDDEGIRDLPALGVSAQSLHFLNYLIAEPIKTPLLYRSGVLIQVPRPERFAIHKLIVADRWQEGPDALKARKDRAQAAFLIELLAEERPHDLAEAYADALGRGPKWRERIAASLARLPATRALLDVLPQ